MSDSGTNKIYGDALHGQDGQCTILIRADQVWQFIRA